jgi:tRNA-dihydrouridine synthase A
MMDWTDRHCRFFHRLITRHTRLYTEMVTTGALLHGDVPRHLDFNAEEHPVALQLGGSEPADLAHCARLAALGLRRDQPQLRLPQRTRAARRLRRLPDGRAQLVADGVKAMRDAVDLPVTVKHRIGIDRVESYDFVRDFVGTVAARGGAGLHRACAQRLAAGPEPEGKPRGAAAALRAGAPAEARLPALTIVLNGGITTDAQIAEQLRMSTA